MNYNNGELSFKLVQIRIIITGINTKENQSEKNKKINS